MVKRKGNLISSLCNISNILGTALGAWALFGNRRSGSILGGTGLGSGSGMDANIAIASLCRTI